MSYCDQCARLLRDKKALIAVNNRLEKHLRKEEMAYMEKEGEIARLTARVAELEGVLREIAYFDDGTPRKHGPYYAASIASAAITKGESRD